MTINNSDYLRSCALKLGATHEILKAKEEGRGDSSRLWGEPWWRAKDLFPAVIPVCKGYAVDLNGSGGRLVRIEAAGPRQMQVRRRGLGDWYEKTTAEDTEHAEKNGVYFPVPEARLPEVEAFLSGWARQRIITRHYDSITLGDYLSMRVGLMDLLNTDKVGEPKPEKTS